MAEGYLYDRGDELIERKDLSESLVPKIDPDTDEGKVLTVDSEGKAGWETPESGLPAITPTTDQGKVLTVGADDEPEWEALSGSDIIFIACYFSFSGKQITVQGFNCSQLELDNMSREQIATVLDNYPNRVLFKNDYTGEIYNWKVSTASNWIGTNAMKDFIFFDSVNNKLYASPSGAPKFSMTSGSRSGTMSDCKVFTLTPDA